MPTLGKLRPSSQKSLDLKSPEVEESTESSLQEQIEYLEAIPAEYFENADQVIALTR